MKYIVETKNLCKKYGTFTALNGLSASIPKGSIYGLVGRNGAGKTTFMRIICGLQDPSEGEYSLFGAHCKSKEIFNARRRIGAVIESPAVYQGMSARENLLYQNKVIGMPSDDNVDRLLCLVGLENTGDKKVHSFSLGMRQRLGIAIAMAASPELLILDEPINGLDPQGIIEMRELIIRLNKEYGVTIVVSSHILGELSKIATHYGFISAGTIVKEMSSEELLNSCRHCISIKTSDNYALARAFYKNKIEYRIISDDTAEVYENITISALARILDEEGCEIISANSRSEDLEAFFINLVGGISHA
jgi:ABC-2 type transport system ATP-binding protein